MKKIKISVSGKDNSVFTAESKTTEQLELNSIECIFSKKIHSTIILGNKSSLLVRKSLNEWEKILPAKFFIRINRAVIINLNYVKQIRKSLKQTMLITMQNYDSPLIMSRSYSTKLKGKLII